MTSDYKENKCLICKGHNYHTVANKVQGGSKEKTVICKNCGLIYRILKPSNNYSNHRYYRSSIPTETQLIKAKNRGIEISNWLIRTSKYLSLGLTIDEKKSVLDIGSGNGGVLKIFHDKYGCQILGVETDESYANYSSTVMNVPTINERFEDASIDAKLDIITMSYVIFCFVNPYIALRKARVLLKKEGVLYISFGDYFHPKVLAGLSNYLFKSHVLYYFTPRTMSLLLNMSGLSILAMDTKRGEIKFLVKTGNNSDKQLSNLNPEDFDNWREVLFKLRLYDCKSIWRRIKNKGKILLRCS